MSRVVRYSDLQLGNVSVCMCTFLYEWIDVVNVIDYAGGVSIQESISCLVHQAEQNF